MAHPDVVDEINQHATRHECPTQCDERHRPQPEGRPQNESDRDEGCRDAGSESQWQCVARFGIRIKPSKALHIQVGTGSSTTASHHQDPLLTPRPILVDHGRLSHDPDRFEMIVTLLQQVSTIAYGCADQDEERRRSGEDPIREGCDPNRGPPWVPRERTVNPPGLTRPAERGTERSNGTDVRHIDDWNDSAHPVTWTNTSCPPTTATPGPSEPPTHPTTPRI